MRIVVIGSRAFGLAVLQDLEPRHRVAGVSAPPGAMADQARWLGIDCRYPLDADWLASLDADVAVAAHAHDYVGQAARAATRFGVLGYHPSLLPRHRGRDAVRWTIRMRDPIAGGTVYWFDEGVDTGPIVAQDWCHVDPRWDASQLWREQLFPMGVRLLREALPDVPYAPALTAGVPQDGRFATWEPALDVAPLAETATIAGSRP